MDACKETASDRIALASMIQVQEQKICTFGKGCVSFQALMIVEDRSTNVVQCLIITR